MRASALCRGSPYAARGPMSYVRAPYVAFRRKPWGTTGGGDVTPRVPCGARHQNINVRAGTGNGAVRAAQTSANAAAAARPATPNIAKKSFVIILSIYAPFVILSRFHRRGADAPPVRIFYHLPAPPSPPQLYQKSMSIL